MGIQGLSKLIADIAPSAIKECDIKSYFGRKVAIDASMSLYQFLIAVRQEGVNLTSADGETTSHLMGLFYRTIRMLDNGIKPLYVFDGKPPELKSDELNKRQERRDQTKKALIEAEEKGDVLEIEKLTKRMVKVTEQHNEEAKFLLKLMGIPYIEAPCEAEAQCAALVKAGKVYATGTEDMDALTFGSNILLRHLTFSEAKKMPIKEFHLDKLLNEAGLSHDQFIDLCILLGCDYCESIKGIGPKRAIELIRHWKSIEEILNHVDSKKFEVPFNWQYSQARQLFKEPSVTDPTYIEIKWGTPDEESLVNYLCKQKGFNEERIRGGVKKIFKSRNTSTQGRLDTFIKVSPSVKRMKATESKTSGKSLQGKKKKKKV